MPGTNLTRDEARTRAGLLDVESYDRGPRPRPVQRHDLRLHDRDPVHAAASPGRSTFVDLVGATVHEVTPQRPRPGPGRRYFDAAGSGCRRPGTTTTSCASSPTAPTCNTGEGLHRFVDPVDNEVYLYTQFEVPDARRVFAAFEQPDLKAVFTFTVTAPAHWTGRVQRPDARARRRRGDGHGDVALRRPPSGCPRYVTALVAGPYHAVRDATSASTARSRWASTAASRWCRTSTPTRSSTVTKQGFAFFEESSTSPTRSQKYDQLFVPGVQHGRDGERRLRDAPRRATSSAPRSPTARTSAARRPILHEMAHMWFGDLVTMRGGTTCGSTSRSPSGPRTTRRSRPPVRRGAGRRSPTAEKNWAYRQDQLPSTHPIAAEIRDLEDVEVNFDGITYAKGASVLKQLVA